MARKDYELIARYIRQHMSYADRLELSSDAKSLVDSLACYLAKAFEANNERFNRERFLNACGID